MSPLSRKVDECLTATRGRWGRSLLLAFAAILALNVGGADAIKGVVSSFGSTGTEGGQFGAIGGIAVNQNGAGGAEAGQVYVVDTSGNRVEIFTATGALVRTFGWDVTQSGSGNSGTDAQQTVTVPSTVTAGTFTLKLTSATGTGTLTKSSAIVTGVLTKSGRFHVGDTISGTGIANGTVITAVGASTLTLSATATVAESSDVLTASETTGSIAYNAPAEGAGSLAERLDALPAIGAGGVEVVGGPGASGTPFTVTFGGGSFAHNQVQVMTPASSLLTGGSATVVTTIAGGGYEICVAADNDVCQAGEASAGDGGMSAPQDIAVDQTNGNLYVTDEGNRRVDVFSADGAFEGAFGLDVDASNPSNELQYCPATDACQAGIEDTGVAGAFGGALGGLAVDPFNDNLLVADGSNRRVDEFSAAVTGGVVTSVSMIKAFGDGVVSYGPDNTGTAAVQQVKVVATGGTFTLGFGGQSTGGAGTGTLSSGSKTISSLVTAVGAGNLTVGSAEVKLVTVASGQFVAGQPISGTGIPVGTTVISVGTVTETSGTRSLKLSNAATATVTGAQLSSEGPLPFAVGQQIAGAGIPLNTTVTAVGAGMLTLSQGAIASATGVALISGLPYNAAAAEVQSALDGLSSIGGAHGSIGVTGGPGNATGSNPYVLTFGGSLQGVEAEQVKVSTASLGVSSDTTLTCVGGGENPSYQWLRNGQSIGGQTSNTYTTGSEDEGKAVQCQSIGGISTVSKQPTIQQSTPATVTSPFPLVAPPVFLGGAELPAPTRTGPGALTVESGDTLSCNVGSWSGAPAFSYQWYKNGVAIGGEIGPTYAVNSSTEATYQCVVTATNAGGSTVLSSDRAATSLSLGQTKAEVNSSTTATTTTKGSAGYEICVPANGDVCKTGLASSTVGAFGTNGPTSVVADSNGEIYATDTVNSRVESFNPAATSQNTFDPGQLSAATALAMDESDDDLYAVKPAGSEQEVLRVSAAESLLETDGVGSGIAAVSGIAYNQSSGSIYLTLTAPLPAGQRVAILNEVIAPTVKIEPVTGIGETTATFHGEVDPNPNGITSVPASYHFEYSTNGTTWVHVPTEVEGEESAGSGTSEVAVSKAATGLSPSTLYLVRLVAHGSGGTATSGTETFTTSGAVPTISQTYGSSIGSTDASLYGEINPNNQSTTYYFQYVSEAAYDAEGFNHAIQVPAIERHIGSGVQLLPVSESISGLEPGTTYDFRLVATNAAGAPVQSPTRTFMTATLSQAATCPNEALRRENDSTTLPDCRAYEMVTPPYQGGSSVGSGLGSTRGQEAVNGGKDFMFKEIGTFADAENSESGGVGTYYEASSGPDGWQTTALDPSPVLATTEVEKLGTSIDGATTLWSLNLPSQLWRREASGEFIEIGPAFPPGTQPPVNEYENSGGLREAHYEDSSEDFERVLFTIDNAYWPGDGTTEHKEGTSSNVVGDYSLYEYASTGDQAPTLVSDDNAGLQLTQCGTEAAGSRGAGVERSTSENPISTRGWTVFFEAQAQTTGEGCKAGGPSATQLYARIGEQPAQATVVNVAAAGGCESSPYCDITSNVTFDGAASDGSRVFFTSSQGLLPIDTNAEPDIYECELPGDGGTQPVYEKVGSTISPVNHCPMLKLVTATESGQAADVLGVVRVALEGTRVYYVAKGVVTSAVNPLGETAQPGADNMYVYDAETGHTQFVATLAASDSADWTGTASGRPQATPDGDYLVFTSSADLTPDDTSSVAQVFRYDASSEQLIRVSIGEDGYDQDGNTTYPDFIPIENKAAGGGPNYGQIGAISSDGRQILFGSEAALAEGAVGGGENLYEYREGNVGLVYEGPLLVEGHGVEAGIDRSGENIFFLTGRQLVPEDIDTADGIYDAHVDGGFEAHLTIPGCEGEACLGPFSEPFIQPIPGSTGSPQIGNLQTHVEEPEEPTTITKHSVHGKTITLTVKAPAKGTLTLSGAGLTKITKSVPKAGSYKLKTRPTKAEGLAIKREGKVKLKVRVTFRPSSGKSTSATTKVTLRS